MTADRPEAFGRGEHPDANDKKDKGGDDNDKQSKGDKGDESKDDAKGDDAGKGNDGNDDKGKGGQEKKKVPFYKRPLLMVGLSVLLLAGLAAGLYAIYYGRHYEGTDDAFIDGRIVRVAPRVAGKVIRLSVNDNEVIGADQELIEIDPAPYLVKREQAVASRSQAEAQLSQAKANEAVSEAQAAQADADVTVANANASNAQKNIDRFTRVSAEARSQQQLDQATADQKATAATVQAQQKKADSMHAMVRASQTAIDASVANVGAAQAMVDQANLDLKYCHVVSGYKGRVTLRQVNVGDYVTVGQQVLNVVPTDVPRDIWVTANYKESQLAHMAVNQRVTIKVDAFPDELLHGHIDSIQNGTGAVFSLLPPENATGNYVKVVQRVPVKILIDDAPRHLLSPGLSVEPTVDIGPDVSPGVNQTNATDYPNARDRSGRPDAGAAPPDRTDTSPPAATTPVP